MRHFVGGGAELLSTTTRTTLMGRRLVTLATASSKNANMRSEIQQQERCASSGMFWGGIFGSGGQSSAGENTTNKRQTATAQQQQAKPPSEEGIAAVPESVYGFRTMPNGLRVATLPTYGKFCTVGVAVQAGPRYEAAFPPGTAHFVEKLAFSGSKSFSRAEMLSLMEKSNALVDCQSSKDTFMYAASCRIQSAREIITLIADSLLRPTLTEEHMETARHAVRFEHETLSRQPECEPLLTDWIHGAAFQGNTLGLSRYCPPDDAAIGRVKSAHVLRFLAQCYTPGRIVLAGVGLPQNWLEALAEELFDEAKTTWAMEPGRLQLESSSAPLIDQSLAQYTGGEIRIEKDLSQMALGPTPFPNLAHIVVGFAGAAITDPDFVPFCVLQALMGGGGSFSAGGPGKGMYTRLYTDVMNHYHWVYNATAFNHSYTDAGLFCVRASADPARLDRLPAIVLNEFSRLASSGKEGDSVGDEELARAKRQLKSQLMMNLEVRPVQFEDLARQILVHNKRRHPLEYCAMIDAVGPDDIRRVARRMLESKLALVGYGDLRGLAPYDAIKRLVQ